MISLATKARADSRPQRLTVHHDAWTDRWDRVWILGNLWWLSESTDAQGAVWVFRVIGFCFAQAALRSGSELGSQHAPEVAANTLRAGWSRFQLGPAAAWACSDSAPGAVKTSRLMGMSEKRCVVHIIIIPITRTLKGKKPRGAALVPEGGYERHVSPTYLRAYERVRAVCLWLRVPDHSMVFERVRKLAQFEDFKGPMPKVDGSKWESTCTMGRNAFEARGVLAAMRVVEDGVKMPELPDDAQWALVDESSSVLDVVAATVARLQGNMSLLADYVGFTAGLRAALRHANTPYASLFSTELDLAEERNLTRPFTGSVGTSFCHMLGLAKAASLLHPRWRAGAHLGGDLDATSLKVWNYCLSCYMQEHDITDAEMLVEAAVDDGSTREKKQSSRVLRGMEALDAGLADVGAVLPVPIVKGVARRRLREAVLDEGRAFRHGTPCHDNPLRWWPTVGKRNFPFLYDGAIRLLQHRAGNPPEERFFSTAGRVLSSKHVKNADVESKLLLNSNGHMLGLPGYIGMAADAAEDVADELGDGLIRGYPCDVSDDAA
jgi:hypothetical protein